ncbi:MAG: DNA alkylation repair protein [Acidobacteria bacterium]|nr:DNA alkylation repair protein [Acidobacteriota bacterium]
MENWLSDFDNWGTVDGTCCYLFCRTPFAYQKVFEWAEREPEFEKRAAFALIAYLALHDRKAENENLAAFFPLIERHAWDGRNFVKKAVNWALRQIGKRNSDLNRQAIETARRIHLQGTTSARWIASDAVRELQSPLVRSRLLRKEERPRTGVKKC